MIRRPLTTASRDSSSPSRNSSSNTVAAASPNLRSTKHSTQGGLRLFGSPWATITPLPAAKPVGLYHDRRAHLLAR